MTSAELKTKWNTSQEKYEKRLEIVEKTCKKYNCDFNKLMNVYNDVIREYKLSSLTNAISKQIVNQVISFKETTRDMSQQEWIEVNEYNDNLETLCDALSKLYGAERVNYNNQIKYQIQKNKEESTKIESLWNFLTQWKNRMKEVTKIQILKCVDYYNDYHNFTYNYLQQHEMSKDNIREYYSNFNKELSKEYPSLSKNKVLFSRFPISKEDVASARGISSFVKSFMTIRFKSLENSSSHYHSSFAYEEHKGSYYLEEFDEEGLDKVLEQEKINKYYELCNRISQYVGDIIDCSNLSVGEQHGELNGIVIETKGKAKIETIGAGGYNIQCFHFRVLVNPIK